jgi:hypothetical protein
LTEPWFRGKFCIKTQGIIKRYGHKDNFIFKSPKYMNATTKLDCVWYCGSCCGCDFKKLFL